MAKMGRAGRRSPGLLSDAFFQWRWVVVWFPVLGVGFWGMWCFGENGPHWVRQVGFWFCFFDKLVLHFFLRLS